MSANRIHRMEDWQGKRIGDRVVIGEAPFRGHSRSRRWMMRCDCGREEAVFLQSLMNGKANRCDGCNPGRHLGNKNPNWKGSEDIPGSWVCMVAVTAKRRHIAFDVDVHDVQKVWDTQGKVCALTGRELRFRIGRTRKEGSASLDRIDSSKGYIVGNIQIIHKEANFAKQSLSNAELIKLCKDIVDWAGR